MGPSTRRGPETLSEAKSIRLTSAKGSDPRTHRIIMPDGSPADQAATHRLAGRLMPQSCWPLITLPRGEAPMQGRGANLILVEPRRP